MKALLDAPVSPSLLDVLREFGHAGVHAAQIGLARATDSELIQFAAGEQRIVITADLDFLRLLALSAAHNPGLILFRVGTIAKPRCAICSGASWNRLSQTCWSVRSVWWIRPGFASRGYL